MSTATDSCLALWIDERPVAVGLLCPQCGNHSAVRLAEMGARISWSGVGDPVTLGHHLICSEHPGSWWE